MKSIGFVIDDLLAFRDFNLSCASPPPA